MKMYPYAALFLGALALAVGITSIRYRVHHELQVQKVELHLHAAQIRDAFLDGNIPPCSIVQVARDDDSYLADNWIVTRVDTTLQTIDFIDQSFDRQSFSLSDGEMARIVKVVRKGADNDAFAACDATDS